MPGSRRAGIANPALAPGIKGARPACKMVAPELHDLVLVGDFLRARRLFNRRAAGGENRQGRGEPVEFAVMCVTVQNQIDLRPQEALQVLCVAQVLVIGYWSTTNVVVQGGNAQPAL